MALTRIGFFEERPGEMSMMRLLSFLCVLAAIALALIYVLGRGGVGAADTPMLVITFLTAGITGKVVQKFEEAKREPTVVALVPPAPPPAA